VVVDALLKDGQWKIRAIARQNNEKTAALHARGVEIVLGDVTEPDVSRFFTGAYATFIVTVQTLGDPASMQLESSQGIKLVDAAKKAGVQHLVFSTLANVEKVSKGKCHVPHFTSKALVEDHIRALQQGPSPAFKYVTYFAAAFYYQNFLEHFPAKKQGDKYVLNLPETTSISMFDVRDTGALVAAILRDPVKNNGKFIAACGHHDSPQKIVEEIQKNTSYGDKIQLNLVPREVFEKFPFPGAAEIAGMFGWFNEFTYYGPGSDLNSGKSLAPMTTFSKWVAQEFKVKDS